LKNPKDHLDQIINTISDPVFVKDRQHKWVLLNDSNCRMIGKDREELLGKSDYDFFPNHEADVFWKKDEEVFKSGKENVNEEAFTDTEGKTSIVVTKKTLYEDSEGNKFIIGISRDITRRKMMEEKLRQALEKVKSLSLTDDLTKLYNRRGFITLAQQQLKMVHRTKSGLVLLYIDLDGMKKINDDFGHSEGDKALTTTAKIIKFTFRESDIIARIGGDEFVALAMDASRKDTVKFVENLQKKVNAINTKRKLPYNLSLSIGIAHYRTNSTSSIEQLLKRADKRMYETKRKKKSH
jgi:diguanylate cyclase (GGDEF)-like protein/PAS domain S-box-containing protein